MLPPITIESLGVQGCRAYLQPQTFNLHRGNIPLSLAVFAPNAKGKSSLVDAFEYYFSEDATLERLGRRAVQTKAGPLAMVHVHAEESGIVPEINFAFRQGNDRFQDAREVSTQAPPRPAAASRFVKYAKVRFIIRGYELRGFVENTTPERRYIDIVSWFGLDPLFGIQRRLRSLRRQIKQKADSNAEEAERMRDLRRATKGSLSSWDNADVCKWLNAHVLAKLDPTLVISDLSETDAGYQELIKREESEAERSGAASLTRVIGNLQALFKAPKDESEPPSGAIVAFEESVSRYTASVARLTEERARATEAVFNDVWTAAKQLFETNSDLLTCPVCEADFALGPHGSRDAIHVHLNAKLRGLVEYQDAERALKECAEERDVAFRNLKNALETAVSDLKDTESEQKTQRLAEYRETLNAWQADQSDVPSSSEASTQLTELTVAFSSELDRIKQQHNEDTYTNAVKVSNDLIQIRFDLDRIRRKKTELEALQVELNRQALAINNAIVEYTYNVINRLQADMDDLYKDIQGPQSIAPPIRFELPQEEEINQQRIELLIDFAENRKGVMPSGYLSDSQIHTLALALRLSAIRMFNVGAPVIVLDDVVTSYDADHRKNIAAMLAEHFNGFQIVLVTHDEQFFNLLQDHLPSGRWAFKRIMKIEPKFGPKFHDHRTPDELIQALLDEGNSAANEMRQAEEEWLLDICRSFGVKVVIRPVDRPYQFDRGELADALGSFLKSAGMLPPGVHSISNSFLTSLQKGIVENFASHFSDNPYKNASVGDEKARWKEFQEFRNHFSCCRCGSRRFKRPRDLRKPICAKCENPFSFGSPKVDPTAEKTKTSASAS
jgi:hypothetical protein